MKGCKSWAEPPDFAVGIPSWRTGIELPEGLQPAGNAQGFTAARAIDEFELLHLTKLGGWMPKKRARPGQAKLWKVGDGLSERVDAVKMVFDLPREAM